MPRSLLLIPLAFLGACQLFAPATPPLAVATPPAAPAAQTSLTEQGASREASLINEPAPSTTRENPSMAANGWSASQIEAMKREASMAPAPSMATKGWTPSQIEAMEQGGLASGDPSMMKAPASMTSGTSEGVSYVPFNQADYAANLGKKPMVLFFHATWCPICRALDQTIATGLNQLHGGIPVYIVDYDTEGALKQQYDIRIQHTLVAIGADGKVRTVEIGATTLQEVQRLIDAAKS